MPVHRWLVARGNSFGRICATSYRRLLFANNTIYCGEDGRLNFSAAESYLWAGTNQALKYVIVRFVGLNGPIPWVSVFPVSATVQRVLKLTLRHQSHLKMIVLGLFATARRAIMEVFWGGNKNDYLYHCHTACRVAYRKTYINWLDLPCTSGFKLLYC